MHPLYKDAEERHRGYRDAVFELVWRSWQAHLSGRQLDIRLTPINEGALQQVESIWPLLHAPQRPAPFRWREIYNQVRTTPRRFDMAIWNGSMLCGLVVGKASRGDGSGDSNVTIRYLQRAPDLINPLKGSVAAMAFDGAAAYGTYLDRRMLYLKSPLPPVVPFYEKFGFSFVKRRGSCLYMGLAI
jgi:GNAT superfamily N-acetyltransferase